MKNTKPFIHLTQAERAQLPAWQDPNANKNQKSDAGVSVVGKLCTFAFFGILTIPFGFCIIGATIPDNAKQAKLKAIDAAEIGAYANVNAEAELAQHEIEVNAAVQRAKVKRGF